jgi:hypothetical protein
VHADVEPREAHERCEHEDGRSERRHGNGEDDRRREARRGVSRWKRRRRRLRHEHVDSLQGVSRPPAIRGVLQRRRQEIGQHDRRQDSEGEARSPENDRRGDAERNPQRSERSRVREPDEQWIEPVDAVRDDPNLDALVEVDQGPVTVVVVVTVTVSLVAATGTIVRVRVSAVSEDDSVSSA